VSYPRWAVHQTARCDICVPNASTGREVEEGGGSREQEGGMREKGGRVGDHQLQHWLMTHTIPPIDPNGMRMFFQQKLTTYTQPYSREKTARQYA